MSSDTRPMQIAHVLFMDIVGYSALPLEQQREAIETLNNAVRSSATVRAADAADQLTRLPTGDGMALVFTGTPNAALESAIEIAEQLSQLVAQRHGQVRRRPFDCAWA